MAPPPTRSALSLCLVLGLLGCSEGPAGPAGPDGAEGLDGNDGNPGTQTITGSVELPGSVPTPAGVPVRALVLGPDGQGLATVGAGFTDGTGTFSVDVPADQPLGARLLLTAFAPGHTLDAMATASTANIDAVTHGVTAALTGIVRLPGGLGLDAYENAEVDAFTAAARSALGSAGTDLTDTVAVLSVVIDSVGPAISAASGGTASATPSAPLVAADPPETDSAIAFNLFVEDGEGETWDVNSTGAIADGTNDAYDTFFELQLDGVSFVNDSATLRDGRTVVVRDVDAGGSGIDVTRKVFVSPTMGYARYVEVFENPTASDLSVDVTVTGNVGSNEIVDEIAFTSSGDGSVEDGDRWVVAEGQDAAETSTAWWFGSGVPTKSGDDLQVVWTGIVVPALSRVTLVHFAFQRTPGPNETAASLAAALRDGLTIQGSFGAAYYEDATMADVNASLNVPGGPTIFGGAGAAAPGERLMITNTNSAAQQMRTAGFDGRFVGDVPVTTGDVVTIVGDRGTNLTITASGETP